MDNETYHDNREIWKPIPGFEGEYEVSSRGRVRSLDRVKTYLGRRGGRPMDISIPLRGKEIKGVIDRGYVNVKLGIGSGAHYHVGIHRLICMAFHGPCPDGMQAAHINGDRMDNRPENLIWATPSENCKHRAGHGTTIMGELSPNAKLTNEHVLAARDLSSAGWSPQRIADIFGVRGSTIARILRGTGWKHVI